MELEALKQAWDKTNNPENSKFNRLLFKEIIDSKLRTSKEKLLNFEWISLILAVLFIPVTINVFFMKNLLIYTHLFLICMLIILVLSITWDTCKIRILGKINLNKPLKESMIYAEKFKYLVKTEKLVSYYFILPFVFIFVFVLYAINKIRFELWIYLAFIVIAAILSVVFLYKIYDKHVNNLRQSLNDLQALEE
ncbi:MAG: hypothetical protein LBE91_09360 [Tannerella sp.]|jgi:Flp pilus assembly protein TadB|nr:hypothetical protein [Tannerella sp.]